MTIYIDVLFLENFILNFIILYAAGLISKTKIKFWKLLIGSLIGTIYVIIYYYMRNKIYSNLIIKIILSLVMLYVSFTPKGFKEMIKIIVFFYLTSFAFGGAALGAIYVMDSQKITIQNGVIIGNYTLKTIFLGVAIAFAIVICAFKLVKAKFTKKDLLCNIVIKINQKEIKIRALLDTGNLLKEPITNIPVVVVEHTLLEGAIPKEILDNIENILGGDLEKISENTKNEYMSRLKVIPFTSLGKQNGMLLGLKADGLTVEEEENTKNVDKVIIGIYNKKLSKKDEYKALVGIDIIWERKENERFRDLKRKC